MTQSNGTGRGPPRPALRAARTAPSIRWSAALKHEPGDDVVGAVLPPDPDPLAAVPVGAEDDDPRAPADGVPPPRPLRVLAEQDADERVLVELAGECRGVPVAAQELELRRQREQPLDPAPQVGEVGVPAHLDGRDRVAVERVAAEEVPAVDEEREAAACVAGG